MLAHNTADASSHRKFILCTNNENNICQNVTYERIKRVIEREGYAASLKYYRIDYVPINEQLYYEYADQLLRHIRELVELENGVNFIENAEIAIVLTDEELADFIVPPRGIRQVPYAVPGPRHPAHREAGRRHQRAGHPDQYHS